MDVAERAARAKLWLIKQDVNNGYDTYDSAVVVAALEDGARAIHPCGDVFPDGSWQHRYSTWAPNPSQVTAEHIGETHLPPGTVVLASFNAG